MAEFLTPQFRKGVTKENSLGHLQLDDDDDGTDKTSVSSSLSSGSGSHIGTLPSSTEIGDQEEREEEDEEEEEETYSRGRSRSRSILSAEPNGIIPVDPNNLPTSSHGYRDSMDGSADGSSGSDSPKDRHIKSGPLQQREVQALKKGLEEATHTRNKDQVREEEEERRAAETEKKSRTAVIATPAEAGASAEPKLRRVKLLMLGDSGVGKSSLILRYTADSFNPSLVGTVGVNFKSRKEMIDGEAVQVQVWDTAGQEHFHKITTSYYKGANGIILVYDVSDKKSMDNVEYWVKNIKAHASETVHVALVGNKTDLRKEGNSDNCTDTETGKEFAQRYNVPYFETSAKDAINVNDAFKTLVANIIEADPTDGGRSKSQSKDRKDKNGAGDKGGNGKSSFFNTLRRGMGGSGSGGGGGDGNEGNSKGCTQS